MTRIVRGCLWLSVIVAGLALRQFGPGFGLSFPVVKYGGSILWGTMVFFCVAIMASGRPRWTVALISAAIPIRSISCAKESGAKTRLATAAIHEPLYGNGAVADIITGPRSA